MTRVLPFLALVACHPNGSSDIDPSKPGSGRCGLAVQLDGEAPGAVVAVGVFPPRRLTVDAPDGAAVTLSGGVELVDGSGAAIGSFLDPTGGPRDLFLQGVADGPAAVELSPPDGCSVPSVAFDMRVRRTPDLAGRAVIDGTGFSAADVFPPTESVLLALDAADFADQVGQTFDAWLVPHRSREQWTEDATLVDAGEGPLEGTLTTGDRGANQWVLASSLSVAAGELSTDYDVVLDFDRDGALGPGDWLDGGDRPGLTAVRDATQRGPHGVATTEISPGFWTTMRVYTPEGALPGPVPLVVISHGNGHDYTWYDYLGEHFASWGYAVISHRNDTEPGPVSASTTTLANTELFLSNWSQLGLAVDIDPHRVALIGHSRGGEGVVLAYDRLVRGSAPVTAFTADDVRLVVSIAPTLFEGPEAANPHGVTYAILAGSADGDVTGSPSSPETQYFRMFQRSTGDGFVAYVQGADHNDFNCCGAEDGQFFTVVGNPPLIGRDRAQAVAKAYLLALLERELAGRSAHADFYGRSPELLTPGAIDAPVVTQSMPADTLHIEDFQVDSSAASSGMPWGDGALDDGNLRLTWSETDPANGMTWSAGDSSPARGAIAQWAPGDDHWIEWEVPDGDWSGWDELSLRACQTTRHPNTVALNGFLSFSVQIEDASGTTAVLATADYARLPPTYPRGGLGSGSGWVNEFQTVRIPLQDFRSGATPVDLTAIAKVRLRFGEAWGSPTGRIGLDDLELVRR